MHVETAAIDYGHLYNTITLLPLVVITRFFIKLCRARLKMIRLQMQVLVTTTSYVGKWSASPEN